MARGWESKSVEAQIETSDAGSRDSIGGPLSPQQIELSRKREGLRLSRSRVLKDLESVRSPRYRKILLDTLDYLDHQLAQIADGRKTP